MSPEQWTEVEDRLSHPYGRARLRADGHVLTLAVEQYKDLRYVVVVYIDGVIQWADTLNPAPDALHRKYWRTKRIYLHSAAKRAEYAARAKKRGTSADLKALYVEAATASQEMLDPLWPNAKALCRHLRKSCTSIELLPAFDAPEEPRTQTPVTEE